MRLGIDITPLQTATPGGIGVATYETIRALAEQGGVDLVLYGRSRPLVPFSDRPFEVGADVRLTSGPLARAGNIAWLSYGVAPMLARDHIDVFWGTRHVLPRNTSVPLVATLYDFWYLHRPEEQPFANRTLNRLVVSAAMKRGGVFTAISDATADEARRLFPASASRVRTVRLGVDTGDFLPADAAAVASVRTRIGVDGPFVLAIDVHNPRKNFSILLEAADRLGDAVPGLTIVATGAPRVTARDEDVVRRVERSGLRTRVVFAGDVSQADLRALYTACSAFVYPSAYEGFGMPVLEAMACGAPVICAGASSLPEVAGDAAILFDPTKPEALADALLRLLRDPTEAARLGRLGPARAATFTWERTAAGMRVAFEDARSERRR